MQATSTKHFGFILLSSSFSCWEALSKANRVIQEVKGRGTRVLFSIDLFRAASSIRSHCISRMIR